MNRRQFIHHSCVGVMMQSPFLRIQAEETAPSSAESFDRSMQAYMEALNIPGGAVAVLKNGRFAYAKGYGWADTKQKLPVTEDTMFRLASLSKPITAIATLKLIEEGRLSLRTGVFERLGLNRFVAKPEAFDPRWAEVNVGQLLRHTGGWDRAKSFDPMFRAREIAEHFGRPSPAQAWDVIRYMLTQPLDFAPGERYAYSNFGYCLLGRIIEEVTGLTYGDYVRQAVWLPAGCEDMKLGRSLEAGRAQGEAHYYTPNQATAPSVFGSKPERVAKPYGGFNLEAMDAHGGWIASVRHVASLTAALGLPDNSRLLRKSSFDTLGDPPPPPAWRDGDGKLQDVYYGAGWLIRPKGDEGKANYWHSGSLPGTTALWVRRHDGISYVALFNQRNRDGREKQFNLDSMLYQAASQAKWE